jgi:hypothetical protein
LHGTHEYADTQAQGQQVEQHLSGNHEPGGLADRAYPTR